MNFFLLTQLTQILRLTTRLKEKQVETVLVEIALLGDLLYVISPSLYISLVIMDQPEISVRAWSNYR